MPYIPNYDPPKNWFAGRTFLLYAKKFIDEVEANIDVFSFTRYTLAITMISRAIRSALELPPTVESKSIEAELKELDGLISPIYYSQLDQYSLITNFKYAFYFYDTKLHVIKTPPKPVTSDNEDCDDKGRYEAINERIKALKSCMETAIGVFRDIYLRSTDYDRHYYDSWVNNIEDDAEQILIQKGYCSDEKDARKKIDEEDEGAMNILNKVSFDLCNEMGVQMHDDRFWGWDEEDNIWRSFDHQYFRSA